MVSALHEKIMCDEACQEQRKKKKLKRKMNNAQRALRFGPEKIHNAEKNYYEFVDGKKVYRDMMLKRYTKEADELKNTATEQHNAYVKELHALVSTYEAETLYSERMLELMHKLEKENKDLKIAIDNELGITQTNDRKVVLRNTRNRRSTLVQKSFCYISIIYYW